MRLAYRLAAACGEWDVRKILEGLEPEELDLWEAYDQIEPLGTDELARAVARIGVLLAAQHQADAAIEQFYPPAAHDAPAPPQSMAAQIAAARLITAAANAQ